MKDNILANNTILLGGDLTFATAKKQHRELMKFITDNPEQNIIVDLAKVQHSDSAGVALLIEMLKCANKLGKTITLQQLPSQMEAVMKFCNLETLVI